jgi:catalase
VDHAGPDTQFSRIGGPNFAQFPINAPRCQMRVRLETFADHDSQAQQLFLGQTEPEQNRIVSALICDLSEVDDEAVRTTVPSRLVTVDKTLKTLVAEGHRHEAPLAVAAIPAEEANRP